MLLPLPELPERRAYGQEWNSLRAPRMGAPLRSATDHARWLEGSQQHRGEHMQWCSRSFLLHLLRFNSDRQWVGLPSGKAVKAVVYCTLKCLIKDTCLFLINCQKSNDFVYPVFGALYYFQFLSPTMSIIQFRLFFGQFSAIFTNSELADSWVLGKIPWVFCQNSWVFSQNPWVFLKNPLVL